MSAPGTEDEETGLSDRLYNRSGQYADAIRTLLQMAIGLVLVARLAWFGFHHFWGDAEHPPTAGAVLAIVATFLAASTAVELAYFLFTPGPDEAYAPVLLALATAALLLAGSMTRDQTLWPEIAGLVAVVVLLVGMILLKPLAEEKLESSRHADQVRKSERRRRSRRDFERHPSAWSRRRSWVQLGPEPTQRRRRTQPVTPRVAKKPQ
jgi:hypothetical protein